jgi:hypothetical protein
MNHQWEYHITFFEVENSVFSGPQLAQEEMNSRLNMLGLEGWELVSITPIQRSIRHGTARLLASFKRPVKSR